MKEEERTSNPAEGLHRYLNTLLLKDDNWQNTHKIVNVLKTVYKDQDYKINKSLSGKNKKKKNYNKDLEKRNADVKDALKVYMEQETYEVKLRQLHIIASKLNVEVNVDISDETYSPDDE